MIPVTILIMTRHEEHNIARCLKALSDFDDVIVVDSNSDDRTLEITRNIRPDIQIVPFTWNGQYPKKRQWVLDTIKTRYDWVFFVDADEQLTPAFVNTLRHTAYTDDIAGYFVKGQYIWNGRPLHHGLKNNKLSLFNKNDMVFPVINDLHIDGMGEIEGHYQPVFKPGCGNKKIDQIHTPLYHHAFDEIDRWQDRHDRYAKWENQMNRDNLWPKDPVFHRQILKQTARRLSYLKPFAAFLHSYGLKAGFLDGMRGFYFAKTRFDYYLKVLKK